MKRSGFSLQEVLVVLGIIAVLLALIVPAVMYARESARRVTCVNQERQFGVALSNYESAHKKFPGGGNSFNAFVHLLPFMEQQPLHDQIDFRASPWDAEKLLDENRPSFMACPSEPGLTRRDASYALNLGPSLLFAPAAWPLNRDPPSNGAFQFGDDDKPIRVGGFTDGLSHTAFISEMRKIDRFHFLGDRAHTLAEWDASVLECENHSPSALDEGSTGGGRWWAASLGGAAYVHVNVPNEPSCSFGQFQQSIFTASSSHSGGVHVLFGDGRVEFVSNTIDRGVWRAIGSRARNDDTGQY